MAATTPLLPTDLRADEPAPPAPRVATRFRLSYPTVAGLTITTALFVVAVRNTWGCHAWFAYLICTYVLLVAYFISVQCVVRSPRGSAAAVYGWRIFLLSIAGLFAASLFRP